MPSTASMMGRTSTGADGLCGFGRRHARPGVLLVSSLVTSVYLHSWLAGNARLRTLDGFLAKTVRGPVFAKAERRHKNAGVRS